MNIVLTQPVEFALRTLGEDDRQKVLAWIHHLENWEKDAYIRERSHKLTSVEGVYMLSTNTKYRIFFSFEQDRVVILDIATTDTLSMFRRSAEQSPT